MAGRATGLISIVATAAIGERMKPRFLIELARRISISPTYL